MKIAHIGEKKVIMSAPGMRNNYFAWPSAKRLQDGRIAVGASGFRLRHVCPFGKAVMMTSTDEGATYSLPTPVIDTCLDDRDCGIATFGKSGVIVTSFNNTVNFQRYHATKEDKLHLDSISPEDEARDLGATFRISHDGGQTFGPLHKSPVTSPHGPIELKDGTVMWLGRTFSCENSRMESDAVKAYRVNTENGEMTYIGEIENIEIEGSRALSCEPYAIELDDGTILAHIRVQCYPIKVFTLYQSKSTDGGRTWSTPRQILAREGGAPAHILQHSSGLLVCTYGYRGEPLRTPPFGIKVMFSQDNGETWSKSEDIYVNEISLDLGYPSTVELKDGSLLTVFYAHLAPDEPAVILQQKWRLKNDEI